MDGKDGHGVNDLKKIFFMSLCYACRNNPRIIMVGDPRSQFRFFVPPFSNIEQVGLAFFSNFGQMVFVKYFTMVYRNPSSVQSLYLIYRSCLRGTKHVSQSKCGIFRVFINIFNLLLKFVAFALLCLCCINYSRLSSCFLSVSKQLGNRLGPIIQSSEVLCVLEK